MSLTRCTAGLDGGIIFAAGAIGTAAIGTTTTISAPSVTTEYTEGIACTSAAALSVINNAVAQPPTNTNSPSIGSNNLAASVSS